MSAETASFIALATGQSEILGKRRGAKGRTGDIREKCEEV